MKTQPKPTSTSESADSLTIWTIGYGDRSKDAFLELLRGYTIQALVDVRSFPTSRIEHFKRAALEIWLPEDRIEYTWLGKELGGYRAGRYQRHTRTKLFREGIQILLEIAAQKRTCIMCMEPNPRHCHRRFISAYLEKREADVIHITTKAQTSLLTAQTF